MGTRLAQHTFQVCLILNRPRPTWTLWTRLEHSVVNQHHPYRQLTMGTIRKMDYAIRKRVHCLALKDSETSATTRQCTEQLAYSQCATTSVVPALPPLAQPAAAHKTVAQYTYLSKSAFGAKILPPKCYLAAEKRHVTLSSCYSPQSLFSSPALRIHSLYIQHRLFSCDHNSSKMDQFFVKANSFLDEKSSCQEKAQLSSESIKQSVPNVDRNYLNINNNKKVLRIVVEGNIGSGKTTFLSIFAKNCASLLNKPLIVPEPIDLWRNVGGVNIFQLLADDPKRWSFAFQSYVQLTMLKIHEMMPEEGNVKVMERSLFSARYCFVENLYRKGLLQECEYYVLDQWFQSSSSSVEVDLIIYLRTDPDIVYERIKRRGRPEESGITLEYLRALHELHEDWLIKKKFSLPSLVLTIDANIPLEKIMSVYEEKTGGILREHMVLLS